MVDPWSWGGLAPLAPLLAAYARHCVAVPHPWDDGVWQLQCHNASAAGDSVVGGLTELRVWWNS